MYPSNAGYDIITENVKQGSDPIDTDKSPRMSSRKCFYKKVTTLCIDSEWTVSYISVLR